MLNIFAEALLLAARMGQGASENRAHPRPPCLHGDPDEDGLRPGSQRRGPGR